MRRSTGRIRPLFRRLKLEQLEDRAAPSATMVKDVNAGTSTSSPTWLTQSGDLVYFVARATIPGPFELWRTDGTEAGTIRLTYSLWSTGSLDPFNSNPLVDFNGMLFFNAYSDASGGTALWKTNGTPEGTVLVKDFNNSYSWRSSFGVVGDTLYFPAYDGSGWGLWKSDGTTAGSIKVKDVSVVGSGWDFEPTMKDVNGSLFFIGADDANGAELWKSDGTDQGTVLVKDINAGSADSNISKMSVIGGVLYFSAYQPDTGQELWRSDGTDAGTYMVADIRPGAGASNPNYIISAVGAVIFAADDGTHGLQLWRTNGTATGTAMVTGGWPGSSTGVNQIYGAVSANDQAFFIGHNGTDGGIWRTDGTADGTVLMKSLPYGTSFVVASGGHPIPVLVEHNGMVYFNTVESDTSGPSWQFLSAQLWQSDGTPEGTRVVATIDDPRGLIFNYVPDDRDRITFVGRDTAHGSEPWICFLYDPPSANTGGPYSVSEGGTIQLDSSQSTAPNQATETLSYYWDLDGDGVFGETGAAAPNGDEVGMRPTYRALDGTQSVVVNLRVTADDRQTGTDTAIINVTNVTPIVAISGPANGVPYQDRTFTLSVTDPSPVDQAAGFSFAIDWDGNGSGDQVVSGPSGTQVTHAYSNPGTYIVRVTATDKDGATSAVATASVYVNYALLQPDPLDSAKSMLTVGGTNGNDRIDIGKQTKAGAYPVKVNNWSAELSGPLSRIVVYGRAGDDDIKLHGNLTLPAWLYGEAGNDRLKGAQGHDVILGGDGDDLLVGGSGRNLLIGGTGADRIVGGDGEELIITGYTSFDGDEGALSAIMAEWTSGRNQVVRRLNLMDGSGSADRQNGGYFLREGETVFQDTSADAVAISGGPDWIFLDPQRDLLTTLLDAIFAGDQEFLAD